MEFCKLCNWAYEAWLNHRELFDKNPRETELMNSPAGRELERLSIISHEYSLLQIIRLHDHAAVMGHDTLGIEYVLKDGGWSSSVRLEELAKDLDGFASRLRGVRNKILSHNDLAAIKSGATLGDFAEGADEEYFKALQEFVNLIHDEAVGGPWPFINRVKIDVSAFLATIKPQYP